MSKSKSRGCCGIAFDSEFIYIYIYISIYIYIYTMLRERTETENTHAIALYNILDADLSSKGLKIEYAKHASDGDISVASVQYPVHEAEKEIIENWRQRLLKLAYGDAQRFKRLKVLINPYGGKGSAAKLYQTNAAPVFDAAKCVVDVQHTTHGGHATEIAEQMDIDAYDAIVCCSGDGLPYEVFNGLGRRRDACRALNNVAVAMIPCGSGNAMAWNLSGTESVSVTALTIVKGLRSPIDLMSITQGDKRTLSFLTQSFGMVAECDLATEDMRWTGAHRFTIGFFIRLLRKTVWPCDLAMKVELDDKKAIKHHYATHVHKNPDRRRRLSRNSGSDKALPPLKYGTVMDRLADDWQIIRGGEKTGLFYAGNMAIVSKDTNFFPAALPSDGLMDVVVVDGTVPRLTTLKMMDEVAKGDFFNMPEVHCWKVAAYRLTPHQKEGYISVDGESVPFEPFQVEIHPRLGTVLSKSGYMYEADGPT